MEKIIYRFEGTGEVFAASESFAIGAPSLTDVDVRRMRKALDSPSVQMPQGLTIEQMRAFILSFSARA